MKKLILFLAVSLPAPLLAAPEYYVWVDENGITNYSQRNPQGVDAEYVGPNRTVDSRRPGQRPGESDPGGLGDNGVEQTDGDDAGENTADPEEVIAEQRARIADQIAQVKRQNCEIGKNNLAQLRAFARVRVPDGNGGERVLTDQEKQSRIAQAQETIRENCNG